MESSNLLHELYQSLFGWTQSPATLNHVLATAARIVIIIIGTIVLRRVLHMLAERYRHKITADGLTEEEKRLATLASLTKTAISLLVLFIGVAMILDQLKISIGPLLASAGVVGLAVGFGAQNLVRDVVSGFFILLENQYREGDVIEVSGVSGTVQHFGLRATALRDQQGRVHYIPNGEIKLVSNLTQGWSRALIDIGVSYEADIDRVTAVLGDLCKEIENDRVYGSRVLESEVVGIERLDESAVIVRTALRTQPQERWAVARECRRRVLKTFREQKIEIPYSRMTIDFGSGSLSGVIPALEAPAPAKTADPDPEPEP
jgi:moderate conductance mechanosensitive channel